MKIVFWEDDTDREIVATDGEDIVIEDCAHWDNFEEGDMIQHHRSDGFGTTCYRVIEVAYPHEGLFPRGIRLVTIRGAI